MSVTVRLTLITALAIAPAVARAQDTRTPLTPDPWSAKAVLDSLKKAIDTPAPTNMRYKELSDFNAQTEWLRTVYARASAAASQAAASSASTGKGPRDAATGQASGKSAADKPGAQPAAGVATPRDAASGQANGKQVAHDPPIGRTTGQRQHPLADALGANANSQSLATLKALFEQEARQFNTLSNASKARHEMAMAAIRNLK